MSEIKLFVSCHRACVLPKHELLVPMQVGAALTDERFPGFIQDDTGENISALNRSYCELTAQYWAWKNCGADYLGFLHYRRFLYPDLAEKRPYRVEKAADEALLERLGFDRFPGLIERCDIIAPLGENMYVSVRDHYSAAPNHRGEDLARMERILHEREPAYADAMERYFSGTIHYFGNLFVMKREIFVDYCAWLFPLLEEFDRQTDMSGCSAQEKRVDGYLAERLFGVFYTYNRNRLSTRELPRVFVEPNPRRRQMRRLEIALLPPGSKRRAAVKALLKSQNE